MDTEKILAIVLLLALFGCGYGIPKLKKAIKILRLHKYVGWIFSYGDLGGKAIYKLMSCVYFTAQEIDVPFEYRITDDAERETEKEILEIFQHEWAECFFNNELRIVEHKKKLSCEDYFLVALYSFLTQHQCDYTFFGHDMYKIISRKNYGPLGMQGFDATYALNEFSTVYHKLLLISCAGCIRSESLNFDGRNYQRIYENIKKVLDTKQIEVSKF